MREYLKYPASDKIMRIKGLILVEKNGSFLNEYIF
jgi:hypothetical protein